MQTMHRLILCSFLLFLNLNSDGQTPVEKPEKAIFELNFEHDFNATSTGKATPENREEQPQLTNGFNLKGASFKGKSYLKYESEKNMDNSHGTLIMWVQVPAVMPGKSYCLFKNSGTINAESSAFTLLLSARTGIRAGIGEQKNSFINATAAKLWKKGEWHQVAFSWSINRGLSLYLDGDLATTKLIAPWKPDLSPFFTIGGTDDSDYESWNASIDEISSYDDELSAGAVVNEYARLSKSFVAARLANPFLYSGKTDSMTIMLLNRSAKDLVTTEMSIEITGSDKQVQKQSIKDQLLPKHGHYLLKIPISGKASGKYPFTFSYKENEVVKTLRDTIAVLPEKNIPSKKPLERILVEQIDASTKKTIAESAPTSIVKSALGYYREAGNKWHDRFAINFQVTDLNKPYLAIIKYPDDKPRTMEVILQDLNGNNDYQAQTGVATGDEYALSGKFKEYQVVFWPKSRDQSFIFMTAENDRPAAVSAITIYKLNDLPVLEIKDKFKGSVPARRSGIYYEDPALNYNFGYGSDISGFSKSVTNLLDYTQSFGQNTLTYPVAWYDGPMYTTSLISGQGTIGGDRPHPTGYVNYFLKSLAQRGMKFNAGVHMHTLTNLEQEAVTDKTLVSTGTETVLNVKSNGVLWFNRYHGSDPGFNPIDPQVEKGVSDVVSEIAEQFAGEPAFDGVTLVMARVKLFGFGSLESGYNDMNLKNFQKETRIVIPGYNNDNPNRFAESYKWLTANATAKNAWIEWRCLKMHEHYKAIAAKLVTYRKDLKLTLNVFIPVGFYERMSNYLKEDPINVLLESGLDPKLYANDPNIVLSFTEVPADYRLKRSISPPNAKLEAYRTVFTEPKIAGSLNINAFNGATVIVHDRYWEDNIGSIAPLKFPDYPKAVECRWRVSTINATDIYSIEPYVFALNNADAVDIVKGGFLIGTMGMENEIIRFTSAFQTLPAVKFDDVEGMSDPVRVRQKVVDGHLYFYVLNNLPTVVKLQVSLENNGEIVALGKDTVLSAAGSINLELAPYGLSVFKSKTKDQRVVGGSVTINTIWLAALTDRFLQLEKDMNSLQEKAVNMASYSPYFAFAKKCFAKKEYARLYFLLQEGWAKDINKLINAR